MLNSVRHAAARLRARLTSEEGFSMVVVLGALLVGTIFTMAAIAAADADIRPSRADQDSKLAYAAAEAGVADYRLRLERDGDAYLQCDTPNDTDDPADPNDTVNPVVQRWSGTGTDTRGAVGTNTSHWRAQPGTTGTQRPRYAIELLPAAGYSSCQPGVRASMVGSNGAIRIRATGRFRGSTRSVVATMRRRGFTDYVYFTDYETVDPALVAYESGRSPSANDALCAKHAYGVDPRPSGFGGTCKDIPFIGDDEVNGPAHTNDRFAFLGCGGGYPPMTMGRSAQDRITMAGATTYNLACTPTYPGGGRLFVSQPLVSLPPSLSGTELATTVLPEHAYVGATTIVLGQTSYTVTNAGVNGGAAAVRSLPANGLIYVTNGVGCTDTYNPEAPYTNNQAACADVRVQGTYRESLTIASQKDVIVTEDLIRASGAPGLMGLIAEQYVRVYHPLTGNATCPRSNPPARSNAANSPTNIRIEAALLALQHSFTVDNHNCGQNLGTMTVVGTIAQKFRGYVFSNGNDNNPTGGYYKDYQYDERMRGGGPPYFVSPTASAWRLQTYNEQRPAW